MRNVERLYNMTLNCVASSQVTFKTPVLGSITAFTIEPTVLVGEEEGEAALAAGDCRWRDRLRTRLPDEDGTADARGKNANAITARTTSAVASRRHNRMLAAFVGE